MARGVATADHKDNNNCDPHPDTRVEDEAEPIATDTMCEVIIELVQRFDLINMNAGHTGR